MNLWGFIPGFINGLIGTGGGILAVSLFSHQKASQNEAHATAVGLMFPLSAVSLAVYLFHGEENLLPYWPLLFPAVIGSLTGSLLLKKMQPQKLRLLFILLILYSAIHILRQ